MTHTHRLHCKRNLQITTFSLLAIAIILLLFVFFYPDVAARAPAITQTFTDQDAGFSLGYPDTLEKQPANSSQGDTIVLIDARKNFKISAWKESGLGILASSGTVSLLDQLKTNVDRQYPAHYPDIDRQGIADATLGGQPAFRINFSYMHPIYNRREHVQVTVTATKDSAFYVQCSSPVSTWPFVEPVCRAVTESFVLQ